MGVVVILCFAVTLGLPQEDKLEPGDRERARTMLSDVADAIRKNYYDPKYRSLDLNALEKSARGQIDQATSFNQMLGIIAWFTQNLNDTHTYFIPPQHAFKLDYGWRMQMVGDRCLVTRIRPGTDAEKKGLKSGDTVISINGSAPTRETLPKIGYVFDVLRPQPGLRLLLKSPDGTQRTVDIQASIKPTRREIKNYNEWMDEVRDAERTVALYKRKSQLAGNDILIWKLKDFDLNAKGAENVVNEAVGRKALILDLRGNPGGSAEAVLRMIGHFFEQDIKVAEIRSRKKLDLPPVGKGGGSKAFVGKLIVLVDSDSASASEILARAVQLEKRGQIIGDRTAGAVMTSEYFPMRSGLNHTIFYGASVTVADLIMKDGNSLEHTGVTPDEVVLPTPEDLANARDPVLAHAVEIAGGKITAEEAGKLFPYEWPPQ
jgi:carboxyl-terminal processing protease